MAELQNGPKSGYDIITYIHNKHGFLVSSGTVYSLLYALERNNLIEGIWIDRKRVYKLTPKVPKPPWSRMKKLEASSQPSPQLKPTPNPPVFTVLKTKH